MRIQPKRIVCAIDFSDVSRRILSYGIILAREFKAALYVCHVIDLPPAGIYGEIYIESLVDTLEQVKKIKDYAHKQIGQLIGKQEIKWEPVVLVGSTAEEISRMVEEKGIDLVIAATHGRAKLKRLILGSVTERLLRTLTCPLLVVESSEAPVTLPSEPGVSFRKILVGYDFSSNSDMALQYGLSLAQEFQSELHLVHVIEPVLDKSLKQKEKEEEEIRRSLYDGLKARMEKMVPEEAPNWCSLKIELISGKPHEELIHYALTRQMGLIVLGIRGRGLLETLLLGSTTDRVVRRAPCPVLSVWPDGDKQ
ncbi:MAG: universal stress protein [Desulfobacterales bacterium]|nr:universal stress protein [Desulfobacterales bacterium]